MHESRAGGGAMTGRRIGAGGIVRDASPFAAAFLGGGSA
jgi:hypothetical protein